MRCSYLSVDSFTEYCQKVYFATKDYSAAAFVVVNGGLFYLLTDKLLAGAPSDVNVMEEFHQYKTMCEDNLITTLGDINPFLPATKENLQALLMGVSGIYTSSVR